MSKLNHFTLPRDMGMYDIAADEVMYYLYLPIKTPESYDVHIPDERLGFVVPLVNAVLDDIAASAKSHAHLPNIYADKYIYLTVKKMFVGGGITANRPGWHCDGFMSDDLNYVWYDSVPTMFTAANPVISADHSTSLKEFEELDYWLRDCVYYYPVKHLLRLDDKVIHAVDTDVPNQIMRTFVKITVSKDRYNLKDNSKNPLLPDDGEFYDRTMVRNDPCHAQSDVYDPSKCSTPVDDHLV